MAAFALVHSPLVGPFTWQPVAAELRRRSFEAIVPALANSSVPGSLYWQQHANAVAQAVEVLPLDDTLILVGHSGAGMLLPAIRETLGYPVAGYIFLDANIPRDGLSRLDHFPRQEAEQFRRTATHGFLPVWTEDALMPLIPDDTMRKQFISELRPMPLAVYEEPIPVFSGWPDAPCGYISFSGTSVYDEAIQTAKQ
ncbi:MAG TPA: alpha/beta fold hydrolase [Chloroflexia bacterium]|nr:alpha/beta fold hydrolase [Chloroflexia bacterium]